MKLTKLLDGIVSVSSVHIDGVDIKGITLDSRKVKKGYVFIALTGALEHGLNYVQQAVEQGAEFVIYDQSGSGAFDLNNLNCSRLAVNGLALKLGALADRFYQSPSKALDVIGITGTNGKTTCSQFLLQLISDCGVIGTLGWGGIEGIKETVNTTPDALTVQEILADFVKQKKQTVVMEVSSHGLQQGRVNEVCFKGAVFTNLSRDHLDYHGTMKEYLNAKVALFQQPDLQYVVVNADDENCEQFLAVTEKQVKRWAFSTKGNISNSAENIMADEIDFSLSGMSFFVKWQGQRVKVLSRIVGDFNLENILAVMTVLLAEGYALKDVANKIGALQPVSGRMEAFGGGDKPYVFVDYAHTPDALEKLLKGLRRYTEKTLCLVFGCGGDRDKGKRAQMGAVAESFSDQQMITNDNPRLENPEQIINDIVSGCLNQTYKVIQNREKAIQTVIKKADKNDCIVIAGKGHEKYQDINGIKQYFCDQDVVKKALMEWGG
ncbi:MAG: UDP-N-acetylmuramoyl-L-alanyl-D-glutamate--2,6-diaminopimelate ligase [Methylococcales bacterium]|nr:UDP-N-acetylmuramoyl-L-alanyl-D-glutamate--2,6-diaminopimelate ligase [Methylococcales bacterium]